LDGYPKRLLTLARSTNKKGRQPGCADPLPGWEQYRVF
jgi:hypothetical protein